MSSKILSKSCLDNTKASLVSGTGGLIAHNISSSDYHPKSSFSGQTKLSDVLPILSIQKTSISSSPIDLTSPGYDVFPKATATQLLTSYKQH